MAIDHYIVMQFEDAIWLVICGFLGFEYMREQNRGTTTRLTNNVRMNKEEFWVHHIVGKC